MELKHGVQFLAILLVFVAQVNSPAAPPAPPLPKVTGVPDMPKGTAVSGRDDGLSVVIGGFKCFLFGDTMLTKSNSMGEFWVVNSMYHTTDSNPDDGLVPGFNFQWSGYPPIQFVPYTPAEQSYRETHKSTDGYLHGIWPNGQFFSLRDGKHYITFDKVIERPGDLWIDVGSGLAVLPSDPINNTASRVQSRPGNTEDYLMWDSAEGSWGHMCSILGDYVYFYKVEGQNYGALRVTRAYLGDGPDAGATLDFLEKPNWQYWDGSAWVFNNPAAAGVLFYGTGIGTIDWNAYLPNGSGGNGCFLYTYMSWVSTNICMRTSSDLMSWSAEKIIASVPNIAPGSFPYFGRAHYGLEKERGRIVYISYCRPAQGFTQDIPMLKVEFPKPVLTGRVTSTNTLLLSWSSAFGSGFQLQQNESPSSSGWTFSTNPPVVHNGQSSVNIPTTSARQFFRLVLL